MGKKPAAKAVASRAKSAPPSTKKAVINAAKKAPAPIKSVGAKVPSPKSPPAKKAAPVSSKTAGVVQPSAKSPAKAIVGRAKPVVQSTKKAIVSAAKSATAIFTKTTTPLLKASQSAAKKITDKTQAINKALVKAAKDFGRKSIITPVQACPFSAVKKAIDLKDNIDKLRILRIGDSKDKLLTVSGARKTLDWSSSAGKFSAVGLGKKLIKEGAGKAAVLDGVIDMADEALNQYRTKKFQPSRLAAKGATGAAKGLASHAATGLAIAGTAAGLLAAGISAPAWVPVAAGVAVGIGVSLALDKIDKKFKLTDRLASGLSSAGKGIGSLFKRK